MLARYLERGEMTALYDDGLRGVCIVTEEGDELWELQNIAIDPMYQGRGYGRALISHILERCAGRGTLRVGTGGSAVAFYEACGFSVSHTLRNYFPEHYRRPIFENGERVLDKVYLIKEL